MTGGRDHHHYGMACSERRKCRSICERYSETDEQLLGESLNEEHERLARRIQEQQLTLGTIGHDSYGLKKGGGKDDDDDDEKAAADIEKPLKPTHKKNTTSTPTNLLTH